MSAAVLDTSVAIAWYLPQPFSEAARTWQARLLDGRTTLYVPSLHYWEFANVMRTYARRKELEPDFAEEIWALHLDAPLEIADPPRDGLLKTALAFDATAYDAVYITLARELDIPIVTAERSSTAWVARLGDRAVTLLE